MPINIYSAPGCVRCKTIKTFLETHHIIFQDHDSLGSGKEAFRNFYKKNRPFIYRGPDGVEFPICSDGEIIRQGLPQVLACLMAGSSLDGYFKPGTLHGSWVDGIYISDGDPQYGDALLKVLEYTKKHKFKIQLNTNGLNASLLKQLLEKNLIDRITMEVKGPLELYPVLLKKPVDPKDIKKSIDLVSRCKNYTYMTFIAPIIRREGESENISYITPEEISETARLIEMITKSSLKPYKLRPFYPKTANKGRQQEWEPLTQNQLFQYRTSARKYQFKTEIEKI